VPVPPVSSPPATDLSPSTALHDGHQLARGAAANVLVLVAANFRGVFTFLIARLLGGAALGAFGLMATITDMLSKPGTLGFEEGMVPLVARRRAVGDGEGARLIFRRGLVASLAASVVIAIVGIAAVEWLVRRGSLNALGPGASLMLLALPAISLARISTAASRASFVLTNEFYSRGITETLITIVTFVGLVAVGLHATSASLAVVVGSTCGGGVAWWLARRALRPLAGRNREGRVDMPAAIRYAAPIAGSGLLNVLILNLDVLILSAFVGHAPGVTPQSFGVFCAAAEIAGGMRKVRQVFDPIFGPVAASRDAGDDPLALKETVKGPGRWVLAAQLPIVGALALASGTIMSIYGQAFREGALWLALLAVAHATNSFGGLVETLMMIRKPTLNLINATVTVLAQLMASWVLIPRFGVTGAAVAMGLGFVVQGILRFAEMKHVFGWSWPWQSLMRPVMAFAVAMTPALPLRALGGPFAELGSAAVFIAGYVLCWLWLGADPEDREIWRLLRGGAAKPAASPAAI